MNRESKGWTWRQSTGELRYNGALVSRGYSGKARGKNNPALQGERAIGPIPRGRWLMTSVYDSKNVGPFTITLHAADETVPAGADATKYLNDIHEATGRSAFRIHGDSIRSPGTASKGCIILPRDVRQRMWRSGDRTLEVIE